MAFFDKLNNFAKNISDKTTDAIETGKLQSKINNEKNLVGEELKKIGEFYYNIWLSTGEIASELLETCTAAKAHYDAVAEAQAEIERIRTENEAEKAAVVTAHEHDAPAGGFVCSACGTENNPGTKFCCNCGNKLDVSAPLAPKICPNCGATIADGMRFCGECGTKTM